MINLISKLMDAIYLCKISKGLAYIVIKTERRDFINNIDEKLNYLNCWVKYRQTLAICKCVINVIIWNK